MYDTLLLILGGYLMALAWFGYRSATWMQGESISEQQRIGRYRVSMLWNLLSGLGVAVIGAAGGLTMADLGFRPVNLAGTGPARLLGLAGLLACGVLALLFVYQILGYFFSPGFRQEQAQALAKRRETGGWYDRVVDNLIPRTRREKKWYLLSSLVAGMAEELVFRGFGMLVLGGVLPAAPGWSLALGVGGMFGLAHCYQGAWGVVKTACFGVLFGLLYIGTDSLLVSILLHTLFDISSAFLYESRAE